MTMRTPTLRVLVFSLFSFALGVALVAAIKPNGAAMNIQDDRAADREAIRAHIDSIFQAFIKRMPRRCARRMPRTGSAIWKAIWEARR